MKDRRLTGLRRFAAAITLLNIVGHAVLGFEASWASVAVSMFVAYGTELLLETIEAWSQSRRPLYAGGPKVFFEFLLPAHITAMACAMLLYVQDSLFAIAFASATAIASKTILGIRSERGRRRHLLNPSNTGIALTLLLFPWIGVAPPYQFTENVAGAWDVVVPGVIVVSGTFLNAAVTRRLPLIAAWLGGFAVQAILRTTYLELPTIAALLPMSGMAFLLFTFYMVTDPATTPEPPRDQVLFGLAVAAAYSLLQMAHVVFGLFFALGAVCSLRLAWGWLGVLLRERAPQRLVEEAEVVSRAS